MRSPAGPVITVALCGLAVLAAGCGSDKKGKGAAADPSSAQVRTVVTQFGVASANKDYRTICDRLIAKSLSDNVEELGLPCEDAFKKGLSGVEGARLRVESVQLQGTDTAYAKVHTSALGQSASDDTMKLVRVGAGWRISALSAPAPPKPKRSAVPFW